MVLAVVCWGVSASAQTPPVADRPVGVPLAAAADDEPPIFSGPQVGEPLPAFTVRGVFDEAAGQEFDFVTAAGDGPIVLVFVHDLNRQSIGMTRVLTQYTASRKRDGLATGIVWLDDDITEAESTLRRIRHALAPEAPVGISIDGREGPGSYGLNRNVMLTILVAKQRRVTANYALVQPSLQADLPAVLQSVIEVAGGPLPELADLLADGPMARGSRPAESTVNLRPLLAPLIRRDASVEQVDAAAKAIEERIAADPKARAEVGRIAATIVSADKLSNYGTERAQRHIANWAKLHGPAASSDGAAASRAAASGAETERPGRDR